MAEQVTSSRSDSAASRSAEVSELREKLAASDEEILRLRDLLIGRDAELGSLKGRVAQLEAGTARLLSLIARVRSLLPGFVWSTLAALRRRRGSQS